MSQQKLVHVTHTMESQIHIMGQYEDYNHSNIHVFIFMDIEMPSDDPFTNECI